MQIRNEWVVNPENLNDLFYTKQETVDSVRTNFDIRRTYSSEGFLVSIDGEDENVIIQDHSNPINEKKTDKKMLVSIDSVSKPGSYVEFDDGMWLITSHINSVGNAYKSCQIQITNYTLKYQDDTYIIREYPCITSAKSGGVGLDEGKIITNPDSTREVILPLNENTVLLRIDKRFFLDRHPTSPTPYKITDVDTTSREGLIVLTVQKDELNLEKDNVSLGICDYKVPPINPDPPEDETYAKINSSSGDIIIIGFQTGTTLSPVFYNSDGTVNSSVNATWIFIKPIGLESSIHTIQTGNNVRIYSDDNFELFGKVFTASVSDGNGGFAGSITLTFGGW